MEFGRIEHKLLDKTDLSLPADNKATAAILKSGKAKKKLKVYVGCAKWGRKDWVGKLYPKGTKEKDFFAEYAKQFNAIEFNAIFYRLPEKKQITEWKDNSPADFLFCPKFTDTITHIRRLKNAQADVDKFLECVSGLGKKLGPVFLMPHPQMGPDKYETIIEFLVSIPQDIKVFLELRHPGWYEDNALDLILPYCEALGVGTVITDTAGRRDCVHMHLTTSSAFIRFVGNSLHKSDYTRIDDWVKRIKKWIGEGIQEVYFFMHQHDELYSPELVKYLIDELNEKCDLKLKAPVLLK